MATLTNKIESRWQFRIAVSDSLIFCKLNSCVCPPSLGRMRQSEAIQA
jgi:hypothetical protein